MHIVWLKVFFNSMGIYIAEENIHENVHKPGRRLCTDKKILKRSVFGTESFHLQMITFWLAMKPTIFVMKYDTSIPKRLVSLPIGSESYLKWKYSFSNQIVPLQKRQLIAVFRNGTFQIFILIWRGLKKFLFYVKL